MSSSLNSRHAELSLRHEPARHGTAAPPQERRRALISALALAPLLAIPRPAQSSTESLRGLQRWGKGSFRRFGFLVYDATLWAGDDPRRPPLALRLDYQRNIAGKAIAEASVKEMRRFVSDDSTLQTWGTEMQAIFPDVKTGDHILGVYHASGARFYHNDQSIGTIENPDFAAAFFAIWLDERTSAPELRTALLMRQDR